MTVATAVTKPAAAGRGGRRYALLLALRDSDYAKKVYGGYRNVFVCAFGAGEEEKGETWDSFRVIAGEFPAAEDLASYDGFVITGSPHDAHGEEPWVRRLCSLVRTLHAMGKRVLGVCFGHQVLCRALGGRVDRARNGWDVGVKKVTFVQDSLEGFDFLGELDVQLPSSAALIEVHQDEVWEIPPGATVLASSEKTRVEVFAVGELALGIQGHPEYTADILHNLIDRLTGQGAIQGCAGDDARRTVAETGGPDRAFWTGDAPLAARRQRNEAKPWPPTSAASPRRPPPLSPAAPSLPVLRPPSSSASRSPAPPPPRRIRRRRRRRRPPGRRREMKPREPRALPALAKGRRRKRTATAAST